MSAVLTLRCPFCGYETPMDYVHGHAQCVNCKTNIAPCCDGASCEGIEEDRGNGKADYASIKETSNSD